MTTELNFYLCDDDVTFADAIQTKIQVFMKKMVDAYRISVFHSGAELLKAVDTDVADVILLDIDMPDMSGFEVAASIQKRKADALILFVTSHEDKVYQSYEYHPFWFVRKSHLDDLDLILPKLLQKLKIEREKKQLTFTLQTDNCAVELNINTLIYMESQKNNLLLKDKYAEDRKVRCKISNAEKQLAPFYVIRVQSGFLVNCRFISKITSREVILTDGASIGLSRSRIDYVKEMYQNYVRSHWG